MAWCVHSVIMHFLPITNSKICTNFPIRCTKCRRVAHIGSKVQTNPPSFAKFHFFLVRFTSALCLVITRRLCSSSKEIWSNGTSTVNVCTKAVRWASARPRLRCDQRRPSSLALSAGLRRVYKKSTLSMVSAFFILLDRSAHSVSLLQGPAKHDETNEGIRHGRTSQALFFRF